MTLSATTVLAGAGIATGLAGSGISAYGQYEQSQAEGRALDANARRTQAAAADALRRGANEAGQARIEGTKVIGEQKAAIAAAGVDVSSGSAVDLMAETRRTSELDAKTIQNNAAREAWGLRMEADDMRRQAARVRKAGKYGAVGTILGGLSGAASGASRLGKP